MASADFTTKQLDNEIWKPCPDYEAIYSVSNLGRIRRDKAGAGAQVGKIIKTTIASTYECAILTKNGTQKHHLVHRLVCRAFHGEPIDGQTDVNHIDSDKLNNTADNLEWTSRSENIRHSFANNTHPKGENRAMSKMKDAEIPLIRERIANRKSNGETMESIAKSVGVHVRTLYKLKYGKIFKHVK